MSTPIKKKVTTEDYVNQFTLQFALPTPSRLIKLSSPSPSKILIPFTVVKPKRSISKSIRSSFSSFA